VDVLQQQLDEEAQSDNLVQGIRRAILTQMGLRDQPILDQFQDSIFRLPLDTCLLLLGPPGTGKTTTLIRRLGQKLNDQFLTEDEKELIRGVGDPNEAAHSSSWLMFTPTDLLHQYLKEAFSREGVPASDHHVRVWSGFRLELARNTLGLLRSPNNQSGFVMQDAATYLSDDTTDGLPDWFDDFDAWQRHAFASRIAGAIEELKLSADGRAADLAKRLSDSFPTVHASDLTRVVQALQAASSEIRELMRGRQQSTRDLVRRALNLQLNRDATFLDKLAESLDELEASMRREDAALEEPIGDDPEGEDQEDDEDESDDEGLVPGRGGRRATAERAYRRALVADALARATGRELRKGTRNRRVVEWIGQRGLDERAKVTVGRNQRLASALRPLLYPIRGYFSGMPARYRRYRSFRQSAGRWYSRNEIRARNIGGLEVDMLLLAVLRFARELLQLATVRRNLEDPFWRSLQPVYDQYRNQVLADEATDFSPVQLACMLAITQPVTQSFFACGDFNQRLTPWGTRNALQLDWVDQRIVTERVTFGYRQSKQLDEFAREVVRVAGDGDHDAVLPEDVDRDGVAPVLLEDAADIGVVCGWLAERIVEIERFVGQLPSTAVLVPSEGDVEPVALQLHEILSEQNINVIGCQEGGGIGQENDVRVFDAQHIKGLEFEAAFFVGVDELADRYPDLFDKFLYVGATRAATYLGLTSAGKLPSRIAELAALFSPDWRDVGEQRMG
ncbi:MAG: ATP-binding domain-containing protein, partial [Gammaproteobacteria bacterium]|nr:ATP-binding domain-containing protein [Gammaproteobacteria bacterium]